MGREESEEYMAQMQAMFQAQGAQVMGPSSEESAQDPGPGVTQEQIDTWERERGVRLPDVLRQALSRQNGGYVYDTQISVLPLAKISCPDEEFWEFASYEEEDAPDHQLVLQFGSDEEFDASFFLNFNARGPKDEPSVLVYHGDPGDLARHTDSVTKFFDRKLKTFDAPSVDWSETASQDVLARETIDLSGMYAGKAAEREQVLVRQSGAYVIYCHEKTPEGERLTKTTLPEPLEQSDHGPGMIQRQLAQGKHELHLQPRNFDGIVELRSERTREGRWKNYTTRGAPICVLFESHDRGRLEALQRTLFGDKAAKRALAQEQRKEELQERLEALTPEEHQAAAMTMFDQMKERLFPGGRPKVENLPTELAAIQKVLDQKMHEIEQRVKEKMRDHPVDPKISRLYGEIINPPDDSKEERDR
jgi:hypothetical protein